MAFKTFTVGQVLTASEMNDYLQKQVNIVCTSATRPSSPVEGMVIFETDTDAFYTYNGSGWIARGNIGAYTTYTPVVSGWSLGNGSTVGRYRKDGRQIHLRIRITAGSTTTFGTGLAVTLPVNSDETNTQYLHARLRDTSLSLDYLGAARCSSTVLNVLSLSSAVGLTTGAQDSASPFDWANGDIVDINGLYETAS